MEREPKVIILVLNWSRREETLECLASLLGLEYGNYEIIVIDNASTDGSVAAIEENFPGVEILRNESNLGFSRGNNVGIEVACKKGADYICLLNNDTVVDAAFLRPLVELGESDRMVGVIGSQVFFQRRPQTVWSEGIGVNGRTGRVLAPLGGRSAEEVGTEIRDWDGVTGAAVLVKREVFEKIGLLDPDYFMYYEDVDFCLRAGRAGYRVSTVPASRVWHKIGSSAKAGGGPVIIYYLIRNHLRLINRHFPLASRPGRWLRNSAIIAYNLAWVLTQPKVNKKEGLKLLREGIRDYFRGEFGPKPGGPA